MADIPDLDIDVIEGPGHAGNRAALDAWATAVQDKLNPLAPAGWLDAVARSLPTVAPGVSGPLRHLTWIRASDLTTGIAASAEGNGIITVASGSLVVLSNTAVPAQGSATTPWAMSWRVKVSSPVEGKAASFGVDAGGLQTLLWSNYDLGGAAQTQMVLRTRVDGSNSEMVTVGTIDPLAYHTLTVGWDGTQHRVAYDHVVVATHTPTAGKYPTSTGGQMSASCAGAGFSLLISDAAYAL